MKLYKLTCPNCKGTLKIEDVSYSKTISCPYCKQEFYFDNGKKEYTINKNVNINKKYIDEAEVIRAQNEASEDSRNFKQLLIWIGILLLIPIIMFLGSLIGKTIQQLNGNITAGSYEELIGKDYKTVEAHFRSAGFNNIELIDLNDSGIAFWNDGKVNTISIGGKTNFYSTDWFKPDTKIVISYH